MSKHRSDAGFSLAALIFFLTAASVAIAAIVPAYQMQAKREQEEELIFRGEEYTRAIQKFRRRFGVYPTSIDQLLSTNQLRFLRRKYVDPITGKDFRLINLNPDGSLTGSKTFLQNSNNQSLFGNTQTFGGGNNNTQGNNLFGNGNSTNPNTNRPGAQTPTNQFGNLNAPNSGGLGLGGTTQGGGLGFGGTTNNGRTGTTPNQGTNPNTNQPGNSPVTNGPGGLGNTGTPTGNQNIGAGGIIGVASDSEKDSIKIYNNRQKYDEWEFIAILNQQNPNGTQNPGANNPNANPQNNPGGINNTNRPGGFGAGNPLGPAGSPVAPNTGAVPGTNPFGGGNPFGTPQTTQPRR
jgi:hypothetical protein